MSGFSLDWLTIRESADDRARCAALLERLCGWAGEKPLLIADMGGGSGATRRALSPLLPGARWRVIDYDSDLLAAIPPGPDLDCVQADLAAAPEVVFSPAPDLITASAFFDLVSEDWIGRFAALLARSRKPLYAALSYDGREEWAPEPAHEAEALNAFHRDMRSDKGFGPSAGPDAHKALAAALRAHGYEVLEGGSDWRLERGRDDVLIEALAAGGAGAREVRAALSPDALRRWEEGRRGAQSVLIGHRDLLAFPQ